MATKATGQKVARRKKDAQSTKSSKPTEAQPPVQAAGGWLEQALLQRSCPEDHTPGTVLAQGGTSPYACRDVCSPTHLIRKVQLLRTFIQRTWQLLISALPEAQTVPSHFCLI